MEFKGTKSKWYINRFGNVVTENEEVAYMPSLTNKEYKEANALLISKAPEMLDMLEELCENLAFQLDRLGVCGEGDGIGRKADVESYGGTELLHKAKQLIKEATEI